MIDPSASYSPRRPRPLSYEDLRRFLFLVLGLVVAAVLIRALADVLILFTIVLFAATVLNPIVVWLEKHKIRRGMAVGIVMLGLIGTVVGVGFMVVPPLVEQVTGLVSNAPTYSKNIEKNAKATIKRFPQIERALPAEYRGDNIDKLGQNFGHTVGPQILELIKSRGPNFGTQLISMGSAIVGGLFTSVIGLMMLAFTLSNPRPLIVSFLSIVPERHRERAGSSFARIETQLMAWMRATVINGIITGISTTVLLHFVGLPSTIVFGALSFFGEFVPTIGPITAALPALFVSAGMGTNTFFLALGAILFVQIIESNVLVPILMGREMELHPLTIVFFALSMGALFGIVGAILAVPMAAITKILVDEFILKANQVPTAELEERSEVLLMEREWPTLESIHLRAAEAAAAEATLKVAAIREAEVEK